MRTVVNNSIAHPRTAVGIDADGRRLLILVVDGRSASSRGYTMVELADMMTALGAENALNLDGGGSSAMYTRAGTGAMAIVNEPSGRRRAQRAQRLRRGLPRRAPRGGAADAGPDRDAHSDSDSDDPAAAGLSRDTPLRAQAPGGAANSTTNVIGAKHCTVFAGSCGVTSRPASPASIRTDSGASQPTAAIAP